MDSPVLIRINTFCSTTDNNTDDAVPEWAMIEVNGELLMPKENSETRNDRNTTLVQVGHVELGSFRMQDEVSMCSQPYQSSHSWQ
jgi:hypothetical protein